MTSSSSTTETTRSARRRMSARERREEIVATAADLFDRHGYNLTSMEDIAVAVGLAKPTLYHYFQSKDEILVAVHETISVVLKSGEDARSAARLTSTQELFEMIVDLLELAETHPGHQRVWSEHYRELPTYAYQARESRSEQYQARMSACLRQGVHDGSFREIDADLTTMQILGMCTWAYQWLPQRHSCRARDVALVFWGNLLGGIAVESATRTSPTTDVDYSRR